MNLRKAIGMNKCPNCGKYSFLALLTNCHGHQYCWDDDCMKENFADAGEKYEEWKVEQLKKIM